MAAYNPTSKSATLPASKGGATDAAAQHQPPAVDLPKSGEKIIALDMDDTMVQTVAGGIEALNELYDLDMTLDDFQSYNMFHNRGWGTPEETSEKHKALGAYVTRYEAAEGLHQALKKLRSLGYRLHIITARSSKGRWSVTGWLENQGISLGPGQDIEDIHFARDNDDQQERVEIVSSINADQILSEEEKGQAIQRAMITKHAQDAKDSGLRKAKAINRIGAFAIVDDQLLFCVDVLENTSAHAVLFGDYPFQKNFIDFTHPHDFLTWQQRQDQGVELFQRPFPYENHERFHRAKSWEDVVKWAEKQLYV